MRVLIVEDERQMAEQLRKGLEREGYSVLVAHDGQHALDLARTIEHDLMILDWMLPKIDGLNVARRLRESKVDTRILMLTARDAPLDVVAGLDGGADDYLSKPFAFEVLLARLRASHPRSRCEPGGPQRRPSMVSPSSLRSAVRDLLEVHQAADCSPSHAIASAHGEPFGALWRREL